MSLINSNIKYLRKEKGLTQEEFANKIGITRSVLGSYEEDRAEPKLQTIQAIASYFEITVDDLLNVDTRNGIPNIAKVDIEGKRLRILSITVNPNDNELIEVVPIKAKAGYLNGYADESYIDSLPHFNLPLNEISSNRTYRIFQIDGDSMKPIPSGSYIITEYQEKWSDLKDNKCYVLLTRNEGLVYKRIVNKVKESNELILKSDNDEEFESYNVKIDNIVEVWKAIGFISFQLPNPQIGFHVSMV